MAKSDVVKFGGIVFRRYPNSEKREHRVYYRSSPINGTSISLHRAIYEMKYGQIPDGYHIHHKDENPLNNDIKNLQCVAESVHLSDHSKSNFKSSEYVEQNKRLLGRIRKFASAWHRSERGRDWHSKQSRIAWKLKLIRSYICINCNTPFESNAVKPPKFCSNRCKSAFRRASGVDNVKRTCKICGIEFAANRYSSSLTCSINCEKESRKRTRLARGTKTGPKKR